jgi:hypothetical protein
MKGCLSPLPGQGARCGVTTSINGPLRRFEGRDFVVGLLLLSAKFTVSRTPFREAGGWKTVVDGVELTRVE